MKFLENDYRLSDRSITLSREEVGKALSNFPYYAGHYQQIVNKRRQTVPSELNAFQRKLASILLPMIDPKTRLDKRHNVVILKPRQVGASTFTVEFINYLCAFVEGFNHMNILHTFPVTDTVAKFYKEKVQPIITGVHPSLFPTMERKSYTSSITTTYHNIKGVPRDNVYELVSANANSIRSATCNIAIFDELAFYKNPEELEAAISPAIPDNGFSLVIYLSTFDDKKSDYFLEKIKQAQEDDEDWTLLFTPWYEMYPEEKLGVDFNSLTLTEYDLNTIIPALQSNGISREDWADYIAWYHKKEKECLAIKKEYPTTLEEVLSFASNDKVFDQNDLTEQKPNIIQRQPYTLKADVLTNQLEATPSKTSPLYIFKPPVYGERYMLTVDPIASTSEQSDYFAASMWNTKKHEQVAVLHGRNLPLEDWANLAMQLANLYNRALICPESNIAQAFQAMIWGQGYYQWWYSSPAAHKNREPGLRTTATTKPDMIEKLAVMLRNKSIIIHDPETLKELELYEKVEKRGYVRMQAPKGKHDDLVSCAFLYAGTLGIDALSGIKRSGWSIL